MVAAASSACVLPVMAQAQGPPRYPTPDASRHVTRAWSCQSGFPETRLETATPAGPCMRCSRRLDRHRLLLRPKSRLETRQGSLPSDAGTRCPPSHDAAQDRLLRAAWPRVPALPPRSEGWLPSSFRPPMSGRRTCCADRGPRLPRSNSSSSPT
ncbi:hypothetical protein CDD83_6935 [Cordyceps sp. RAO-2017]|nr:hypothetical protein CDD83_6935 [Cordyceps sp. RAO-2017]